MPPMQPSVDNSGSTVESGEQNIATLTPRLLPTMKPTAVPTIDCFEYL